MNNSLTLERLIYLISYKLETGNLPFLRMTRAAIELPINVYCERAQTINGIIFIRSDYKDNFFSYFINSVKNWLQLLPNTKLHSTKRSF